MAYSFVQPMHSVLLERLEGSWVLLAGFLPRELSLGGTQLGNIRNLNLHLGHNHFGPMVGSGVLGSGYLLQLPWKQYEEVVADYIWPMQSHFVEESLNPPQRSLEFGCLGRSKVVVTGVARALLEGWLP